MWLIVVVVLWRPLKSFVSIFFLGEELRLDASMGHVMKNSSMAEFMGSPRRKGLHASARAKRPLSARRRGEAQ